MGNPTIDHGDQPLGKDRDLFAPPPPELGEIVSAASTLAIGQQPRSFLGRYALTAFITGGVFLAVYLLMLFSVGPDHATEERSLVFGPPTLLAAIALVITWIRSRFRATCTYVCREGLARFTCLGGRESIQPEILRFADAFALRVSRTHMSVKSFYFPIYFRTNFRFEWPTARGTFCIAGSCFSPGEYVSGNRQYRFALAAEAAWTAYLLPRLEALLATGQPAGFAIYPGDSLQIGNGYAEYIAGGKLIRFDSPTPEQISCTRDSIVLDRPDMVFRKAVAFNRVANASALAILLTRYAFTSALKAPAPTISTAAPTLEGLITDMMNKPPT